MTGRQGECLEQTEFDIVMAFLPVHLVQGFYFARPVIGKLPADHEIGWL